VEVLAAGIDTTPRQIALVIDSSASMGEHSATADAWSVPQSLIAAVTPAHNVALLELREKLELRANLGNDPVTLRAAIDEARKRAPQGPTAVYDAIVTLSRTHQGAGFPDVIYLISDCEDTASAETAEWAIEAAARSGLRVFVCRPARPTVARRLGSAYAQEWAARIAEVTGGAVLEAGRLTEKEIARSVHLIGDVYRVELLMPRPADKPRDLKIEALGPDGARLAKVRLLYPQVLAPTPSPSPPGQKPESGAQLASSLLSYSFRNE